MAPPAPIAIALPLWQQLRTQPFSGYVASRSARACNLADECGRVITLTLPEAGNGPFSIVVDAPADWFLELEAGQRADVNTERIAIGHRHVPLSGVHAWDATLPQLEPPQLSPQLTAILQSYTRWPARVTETPIAESMTRLL